MLDEPKPPWKLRNHLLELKPSCKSIKSCLRNVLLTESLRLHDSPIILDKKYLIDIATDNFDLALINMDKKALLITKIKIMQMKTESNCKKHTRFGCKLGHSWQDWVHLLL